VIEGVPAVQAVTRRRLLRAGLSATLGVAVAAAGCSSPPAPSPSPDTMGADLRRARLAAALELGLVSAYDAAVAAAGAGGRLAPAPAAFVSCAAAARAHHVDHAAAWNALLTANRQHPQTVTDGAANSQALQQISSAQSVSDVATAVLTLERVCLQTYVAMVPSITDHSARRQAMVIAPVEAQHAAVLQFLLGADPVPDTSIATTAARGLADLGG
jgi:hypothetical protein